MIPVDQTLFGHDMDSPDCGNCWAACLASLLELDLAEVPHFVRDSGDDWFAASIRFAALHHHVLDLVAATPPYPTPLVIVTGRSPRGDFYHSVIHDQQGALVHDPHPSRAGVLDRVDAVGVWPR